MKILQLNNDELELNTNGTVNLIVGGILVLVGIGVAALPFVTTAEWWVSLIGLAVAGVAAAIVFTATSTHTILRRGGTSTLSEKRLIGGATKEATFEASQVAQVKLESHTEVDVNSSSDTDGRNGQQQRQRVSTLYIVLSDGTEITVGSDRQNGNGGFSLNGVGLSAISKAPLSNEGKQIADFFGVQLKSGIHDASLQDIVGAVQTAFTKPAAQAEPVPVAPIPAPIGTPVVPAPTQINGVPLGTPTTPAATPAPTPQNSTDPQL